MTCARFEGRVADLVAAYGDSKFATTLAGAAPNLFTFLRHPGMPPTNNDTERDARDAVVVQRKICRRFVNARGMHVFSMIQGFNSTCRKLGLVVWRCMEKMVDDQKYNMLEVGGDVRGVATSWSEAKPVTYRLCVDGNVVETNGAKLDGDGAEALAAEAVKGGLDTECMVQEANAEAATDATKGGLDTVQEVDIADANVASPTQTHLTNNDRPPPTQPHAPCVIEHKQVATSNTPDTLPYRGKPPPAVTA